MAKTTALFCFALLVSGCATNLSNFDTMQSASALTVRTQSYDSQATVNINNDHSQIKDVIYGVASALSKRNIEALRQFYHPDSQLHFFGPAIINPVASDLNQHIATLAECLLAFQGVEVIPDNNLRITSSGSLAIATLTGVNTVVDENGELSSAPWRWTVQLENAGGRWMVAHEHLSNFRPEDLQEPRL